jgi:hypothetical protein
LYHNSRNDDDTLGLLEAIQLHQKLIEGLFHVVLILPRIISAWLSIGSTSHHTCLILGASFATDRVQLVDKNDRGCLFPGRSKQLSNSLGTDSDKHFIKRGTRGEEKRLAMTAVSKVTIHGYARV